MTADDRGVGAEDGQERLRRRPERSTAPSELTTEQILTMMETNEDLRLLGIEVIRAHIRDVHCARCRYTLEVVRGAAHRYGLPMVHEPSCPTLSGSSRRRGAGPLRAWLIRTQWRPLRPHPTHPAGRAALRPEDGNRFVADLTRDELLELNIVVTQRCISK